MVREKGIPREVIKELDIHEVDEIPNEYEATAIVETHQVKLPVPRKLINNFNLEFKEKMKVKVCYDEKKKEIIYKL